jgi:hypothetical protein
MKQTQNSHSCVHMHIREYFLQQPQEPETETLRRSVTFSVTQQCLVLQRCIRVSNLCKHTGAIFSYFCMLADTYQHMCAHEPEGAATDIFKCSINQIFWHYSTLPKPHIHMCTLRHLCPLCPQRNGREGCSLQN